MATSFETRARDGAARLGRFKTDHGTVETPSLLPVINPNRPLILPKEMKGMGADMLITNSYIIRKTNALRERALEDGVHKLLDWDGPIMTDSGTFQMYIYGSVAVTNPEIVNFQRDIGVDVGTILDLFSTPDRTYEEAESDLTETLKRAEEATTIKGGMAIAGTVQGGVYPALRRRMGEAYRTLDVDFHPIGGVVPLMEGQRYADLARVIIASKEGLDASRPVHLFGAGHPAILPLAAYLGCDFFDSASYAKFAYDSRYMLTSGTAHLADMEDLPCACHICARWNATELQKAQEPERVRAIAEHNLRITLAEVKRVRDAIRRGRLAELCEERSRAHPTLMEGWRTALAHDEFLEAREPLSKSAAFMHVGPESSQRPEVTRIRKRLATRWQPQGDILLLSGARRPWSMGLAQEAALGRDHGLEPCAESVFGPAPLTLDEAYPFAQSQESTPVDATSAADAREYADRLAKAHGVGLVTTLPEGEVVAEERDLDYLRIAAVADYQFARGAGAAVLAGGDFVAKKSRKTGKIRTLHVGDDHVLSMRAEDGFFTLKLAGARRLHAAIAAPRLRVVVSADSAPFNRAGKNAFAKFVTAMDPELRAGDECLVVDENDALLAVGQLLLPPCEVKDFVTGVAVSVREGTE